MSASIEKLIFQNYKSYKGKHEIGPFRPFSAIIGPNGAGKSNLMDALSFVLGVHASELRGTQVKDLVHHGTITGDTYVEVHFRLGNLTYGDATSRASVDSDSSELQVFRRSISKRDNSSIYAIDGRITTREAYESTLEAFHVLVKVRNFIVFQGTIERMVAQSPTERMQLLERIAGSDAFRAEYEELETAKNTAESNSIFNFQMKRSVEAEQKQFREQKEEADRADELSRRLGDAKTVAALFQLFQLDAQRSHVESDLTRCQLEADALDSDQAARQERAADIRRRQAEQHRMCVELERRLSNSRRTADRDRPEVIRLQEKAKHLRQRIASEEKDIQDAQKKVSDLERTVNVNTSAFEELQSSPSGGSSSSIDVEEQEIDWTADLRRRYELLMEHVRVETSALGSQLDQLEEEKRRLLESKTRSLSICEESQTRFEEIDDQLSELRGRQRVIQEHLSSQRIMIAQLEAQVADSQRTRDGKLRRREELVALIASLDVEIQEVRVQRKEYERASRFHDAVEHLKQIFSQRVLGRVEELMEPEHARYRRAYDAVFGPSVDAVVVDSETTAIECMKYLKEQRVGLAVFLPLTSIRASLPSEDTDRNGNYVFPHLPLPPGSPTNAKYLYEVVQCRNELNAVRAYICSKTIVCESLQDARNLSLGLNRRDARPVKTVTMDGVLIHKSGVMTGGFGSGTTLSVPAFGTGRAGNAGGVDISGSSTHGALGGRRGGGSSVLEGTLESRKASRLQYAKELQDIDRDLLEGVSAADELQTQRVTSREQESHLLVDLGITSENSKTLENERSAVESKITTEQSNVERYGHLLGTLETRLQNSRRSIDAKHDEILSPMSQELGIRSLREHLAGRAERLARADATHREWMERRISVRSKLDFESSRLSMQRSTTDRIQTNLEKDRAELAKVEEQLEDAQSRVSRLDETVIENRDAYQTAVTEDRRLQEEARTIKVVERNSLQTFGALSKQITANEALLEQIRHRKRAVVLRCHIEHVELPLLNGSDGGEGGRGVSAVADLLARSSTESANSHSSADVGSQDPDLASQTADVGSLRLDYSLLTEDQRRMVSRTYHGDAAPGQDPHGENHDGEEDGRRRGRRRAATRKGGRSPSRQAGRQGGRSDRNAEEDNTAGADNGSGDRERLAAEEARLAEIVERLTIGLQRQAPNMRAEAHLHETEQRLRDRGNEYEEARREQNRSDAAFEIVRNRRKTTFMSAFEHINNAVASVYKELTGGSSRDGEGQSGEGTSRNRSGASLVTGGGVAYLSLENPDDPFKHGVLYQVIPPSKRFRDMDQLSGGEKTLAAVALLFAIYSYRRAPILILDEVDAALDKLNVRKLVSFLRTRALQDGLQILVVSQKEELYTRAQALVGVTRMIEDNSSALLSVDLQPYRLEARESAPSSRASAEGSHSFTPRVSMDGASASGRGRASPAKGGVSPSRSTKGVADRSEEAENEEADEESEEEEETLLRRSGKGSRSKRRKVARR